MGQCAANQKNFSIDFSEYIYIYIYIDFGLPVRRQQTRFPPLPKRTRLLLRLIFFSIRFPSLD